MVDLSFIYVKCLLVLVGSLNPSTEKNYLFLVQQIDVLTKRQASLQSKAKKSQERKKLSIF